ncbi:NAD-dependent epimerase/dehydratase family protein [Desulfovibrio sulfodismutans]|uniref:NAD-dependent epimerase/dehydratase family protein n=1 Tax=Desulfolutivibrio sulfodismutans TaxID=63561 RepID=A0A7K3NSE3_9BACT|nr:NAD-dependent epimerase/dehydratase family protein [Desulfolutivibrio sulfodismutans]NDY58149.1 NAD-dependent epimerase/dehydratase family protein [Desulfolutivibrio sulfodismutans]QLA14605.1 NAD-dependent epimerase/dehydratase family protein [Desulfolutivibrio sulfodismutans DSM 3696]
MLVLRKAGGRSPGAVAALFGLGLIGAGLARRLQGLGYARAAELPFSWGKRQDRGREASDIAAALKAMEQGAAGPMRLDIVWSAGQGGFGMDEEQAGRELADFADMLDLAAGLAGRPEQRTVRVHLLSSAGGLFEGQRNVTLSTPPAPKRCYGLLKLRQEELLSQVADADRIVYRPSSVYGFSGPGRRMGLIPTLLANGARYQVSTIYGAPDTLRDYVSVQDAAQFLARQVDAAQGGSRILLLASARPTSLSEVLSAVETTLKRKIFITYRGDASDNTAHITFSPRALPPDWRPCGIDVGIRTLWNFFCH